MFWNFLFKTIFKTFYTGRLEHLLKFVFVQLPLCSTRYVVTSFLLWFFGCETFSLDGYKSATFPCTGSKREKVDAWNEWIILPLSMRCNSFLSPFSLRDSTAQAIPGTRFQKLWFSRVKLWKLKVVVSVGRVRMCLKPCTLLQLASLRVFTLFQFLKSF